MNYWIIYYHTVLEDESWTVNYSLAIEKQCPEEIERIVIYSMILMLWKPVILLYVIEEQRLDSPLLYFN